MSFTEIKSLLPPKYWYLIITTFIMAVVVGFITVNFTWYLAIGVLVMTLTVFLFGGSHC